MSTKRSVRSTRRPKTRSRRRAAVISARSPAPSKPRRLTGAEKAEAARLDKLKQRYDDAPNGQRETTYRSLKAGVPLAMAAGLGKPDLIERVKRCGFGVGRIS